MEPGGVELASGFDYSGIQPKQQWWLALYRVDVWPASVDDFIGDDRIDGFIVDWPVCTTCHRPLRIKLTAMEHKRINAWLKLRQSFAQH
jgi:hypothetical protein